jgi:hypothetical protein
MAKPLMLISISCYLHSHKNNYLTPIITQKNHQYSLVVSMTRQSYLCIALVFKAGAHSRSCLYLELISSGYVIA